MLLELYFLDDLVTFGVWTLVHTLKFSEDEFWQKARFEDELDDEVDTTLFSRFLLFVHNVLILHKRPAINKFLLQMSFINWTEENEACAKIGIEVWMRFVLSRGAKAMTLDLDPEAIFSVPASIFTSQTLVRLHLRQCTVTLPSGVHMGSLRILVLDHLKVEDDSNLSEFLSGCPSLQELVLTDISIECQVLSSSAPSMDKVQIYESDPPSYSSWTINCPNLKILVFEVCLHAVGDFKVPSVCELTISLCDDCAVSIQKQNAHEFTRFLEGFQSLEVLTLTDEAVRQLTYCLTMNVGFPQNRWKRVVLKSMQDNLIAGICSLVRNSPCLEELIVHNDYDESEFPEVDKELISQEVCSPCVAPHLKLVSMRGYVSPSDVQLQLVEFLLKSAVSLVKLQILSWWKIPLTSPEK